MGLDQTCSNFRGRVGQGWLPVVAVVATVKVPGVKVDGKQSVTSSVTALSLPAISKTLLYHPLPNISYPLLTTIQSLRTPQMLGTGQDRGQTVADGITGGLTEYAVGQVWRLYPSQTCSPDSENSARAVRGRRPPVFHVLSRAGTGGRGRGRARR